MIQKSIPFETEPLWEIEAGTARLVDRRRRRLPLRDQVDRRLKVIARLTPQQALELANRELLQQRCLF